MLKNAGANVSMDVFGTIAGIQHNLAEMRVRYEGEKLRAEESVARLRSELEAKEAENARLRDELARIQGQEVKNELQLVAVEDAGAVPDATTEVDEDDGGETTTPISPPPWSFIGLENHRLLQQLENIKQQFINCQQAIPTLRAQRVSSWRCTICSNLFGTVAQLNRHTRRKHRF